MNRKEFLNSVFRYGIAGSILLLTGFLFVRRKVTSSNQCTENVACKKCRKYSECKLPEKEN
jgi:hypothetical protein